MNPTRTTAMRERESTLHLLQSARIVASFGLLGAVIVGIAAGWANWSFDVRIIGLVAGATLAVAGRARGIL